METNIKDNDRPKINQRWYVLSVLSDIKDNDRLKKNHRRFMLAVESEGKDNDRLKINQRLNKIHRPYLLSV